MSYFKKDELFTLYTNASHMLRDRGYNVTNNLKTFKEFEDEFLRSDKTVYTIDDDNKIIVVIAKDKIAFTKKKHFDKIRNSIPHNIDKIIIAINVNIKAKIQQNTIKYPNITFMNSYHLFINKTDHSIVYKRTLIKKNDVTFDTTNLVSEYDDDAMSIWYGVEVGDVFKIEREYSDKLIDTTNFIKLKKNPIEYIYKVVRKHFYKKT